MRCQSRVSPTLDTPGASPPHAAKGGLTSAPAPDTLQMKSNVFLHAAELLNPARSFQAAAPSLVNAAGVQVVVVAGRQMEGDGDACAHTGMWVFIWRGCSSVFAGLFAAIGLLLNMLGLNEWMNEWMND